MAVTEEDLRRCQDGDVAGLAALYRAFADRTYRICRHLLGQRADAEDATQEVFLRAFDKIRTFRGDSLLSTWIYRLTVNHCLNRLTSRRPASIHELPEREIPPCPRPSPVDATVTNEAQQRVDRMLAHLDHDARAIVTLREIEQLSYREIAEVLDIPAGTVMSRLSRARRKLDELVARRPDCIVRR